MNQRSRDTVTDAEDPWLWLEEINSEAALQWVGERNRESQQKLTGSPDYATSYEQMLEILNARDRVPYIRRRGAWFYNLWQDESHPRGLWRRTTLQQYRLPEPQWETLLDLDALGQAESENWVWAGATLLGPDYRHALISLSRGGADAHVVREFDIDSRQLISDGFNLPEAKSAVSWIDRDTLYVATDFGPGTLTDSGYPREIRRWRRGEPLASASTVFSGQPSDISVSVSIDRTPDRRRTLFCRALDFYRHEFFLLIGDQPAEKMQKLTIPADAMPDIWRDTLLLQLRSDWQIGATRYPAGALLACDLDDWLSGAREFQPLFTPTAGRSLSDYILTREHIILKIMDNVADRLEKWHKADGIFTGVEVDAPYPVSLDVAALYDPQLADDPLAEHYLLACTDFITPTSLYLATSASDDRERLKAGVARFDARGMRVEQRFAVSADGTRIPYFVIWPRDAREDGDNPTLLYGYGGFEISLTPWYAASYGKAWLERGGVLVVANIRGGGEYGPAWHQAAIRQHKQRSYDDFIAVAQDLIDRRITHPSRLGIQGGSNGGLLVGAVLVQRPELFNAVLCQVPLLDMRRYHRLLAGAAWMAEYGDPDEEQDWRTLARYSPYHNLRPETTYPRILFTTSTRDDRVHPGHARKMAARMLQLGQDVLYYENTEGGHGGAADNRQRAHLLALEFSFLWQQLGDRR
ncbi:S9 family peptidase [Affinibrenneria salicis]|uniref:S9 family peptidase n=1 Tax=Affinibrenneria salicis TaxID=2590031 RepID=A0A5J5G1Y6_9GAMM|nr:prolyl oligopeptidase family serine peptidase [Affinibrenneria salicis]KAA9000635.1 S9 family peptidase [Affinibrenneria salicis]